MSDLLNKLRKNTTIKDSDILSDSKFFNAKDMIRTTVPAINIALSGKINGGFVPGLTIWAGPSKHFKTSFSLLMAKAYMDTYPDAVMLFYDSEFGTPQAYFDSFGIDTSRVLHTPITDVEQLKFDIMQQFGEIKRGDHVIIVIDSVGNLASKKEVEDALKQNSAADMTRAKQLKSLFRMVTPHLNLKDIPLVVVNHTYQTQEMYSKAVVSGGTGIYYSADNIFIIGRQQEKDGKEVTGYNFIINVEKSRYVKEKSKIPIEVSWDKGISKWSGLLDMALESGHVIKPKVGWYQKVDMETGEILDKSYRIADTYNVGFWHPILICPKFVDFIENKYAAANGAIMQSEDEVADVYEMEDE
jgi:RecA/RadA recombinase